jgi:hypothetical protein
VEAPRSFLPGALLVLVFSLHHVSHLFTWRILKGPKTRWYNVCVVFKGRDENRRKEVMRKDFGAYFKKLEKLTTTRLNQEATQLVLSEKRSMAALVAHLAEIARRKAHLKLGYKNLFDYCVRKLGLSEGSAGLRIQVANVCREIPAILEALSENRITLSVAGLLAPHLGADNAGELLSLCEGKTKSEVKEILVALNPKPVVESGIRRKPLPGQNRRTQPEESSREGPGSNEPPLGPGGSLSFESTSTVEPARPEIYNYRFAAGKAFRDKVERLGEVLGIERPERHLEELFEKALDIALDRKDPRKKHERRMKRTAARESSSTRPAENTPEDKKDKEDVTPPSPRSRHIPAEVRERVLERAGYQCEYRSGETRCTQRTGLELDHYEVPYGKGGDHSEENLRVLCRRHNLLCAEQEYGEDFVREKIRERRYAMSGGASERAACG